MRMHACMTPAHTCMNNIINIINFIIHNIMHMRACKCTHVQTYNTLRTCMHVRVSSIEDPIEEHALHVHAYIILCTRIYNNIMKEWLRSA